MELREWLIILGLALVTLIVIDGARRLQRQRRIPRLDEVEDDARGDGLDPEAAARAAEINWELPNGGARVVRPAESGGVQPKPKLQRQEHPGASRVLAGFGNSRADTPSRQSAQASAGVGDAPPGATATSVDERAGHPQPREDEAITRQSSADQAFGARGADSDDGAFDEEARREPRLSALDDAPQESTEEPTRLAADPEDHDDGHDDERYRLVDLDGMGDSFKSGSRRMGASMQRSFTSLQRGLAGRREQKRLEKERRDEERRQKAAHEAELHRQAGERAVADEAERHRLEASTRVEEADGNEASSWGEPAQHGEHGEEAGNETVRSHPVLEKALRHDVSAEHARHALSHAEEIIVISVMSRDEEGFSGTALLDLMLTCGLRYSRDMGIFHRFETEDPESQLQFSMVNVLKPGTFPIESMDDFRTTGVTLLMPLPGATDTVAAFEAMVETAMVIVRHLGGELKDENHSVMTAQTVGFARQRVQEFERRNRLNRYQVN